MGHARAAKHAAVKRATRARLRPPYISPVLRNTVMPIAAENMAPNVVMPTMLAAATSLPPMALAIT